MAAARQAISSVFERVLRQLGVMTVVASGLALPAGAGAEVVAVIAGIDDYEHVSKLGGAVYDAEDLAASFAWLGARTVLLLEREVTRDRLLATLDDVLASASPDDVVVFSFAGHGIQVPDRNGDEADGFDEAFVLPGYRPGESDMGNLILDDEIDRLVQRAAPRTVIFLADSCHSGTMLRGRDARADFRSVRFLPRTSFGPSREAATPVGNQAAGQPVPAPDNLIFFGAVPEHLGVQEVLIDGRPRGALSYAFARALQGLADADADGILTSDELMIQVPEMVRVVSENRQTPRTAAGARSLGPLFRLPSGTPAVVPATAGAPPAGAPEAVANAPPVEPPLVPDAGGDLLRVALSGSGWSARASILNQLHGVEVTAKPDAAELILHEPSGDLLTNQGDVAARLGEARERRLLQGIVDKWRLLRAIESGVDGSLQARVLPEDDVFHGGEPFTVRVTARSSGHLVLFDLASDGSLLVLYPRRGEPAPWLSSGETRDVGLRAGPPFGADHLVAALVPAARLGQATDLLRQVHGRALTLAQAERLAAMISPYGPLPIAVYTAP